MSGLTPLPPSILHTTTRLTHSQAHDLLSTFLNNAENDAAYRPDSTLTERGPQSASTGANPNLTLHHLKRILQGIEGKRIGGEDVGRFFGDSAGAAGLNRMRGAKRRFGDDAAGEFPTRRQARREMVEDPEPEDGDNDIGIAVAEEGDGWQDKGDYELAQREGGLEILDDERQPGMSLEQPANEGEAEDLVDVEIEGKGKRVDPRKQNTPMDKEAKKKAKKERSKLDKAQRAEARAKK